MKKEILIEVLSRHAGGKSAGEGFELSDGRLTLFVSMPGETLAIPKVNRVEVAGSLLIAGTAKGERYFVDADAIIGLKLEEGEHGAESRGPLGFGH